jgi:putative transposase
MSIIHSDVRLLVHVIWATNDRVALLLPEHDALLHSLIVASLAPARARVGAFGASDDHVHVLIELAATARLCDVVQALKGVSARRWNEQPPRDAPLIRWQEGYWARSVSPADVTALGRYVREQRAHHGTSTLPEPWESTDAHG